ncbi:MULTISPECIES: SDR family NAD(P)-dependent oxidoreductase [unclassified Mesorhizobium]|uniref:SDR family NAD(P)-dependent oxidoreductase n=1 Tax=unclassified Mesorhizobium TaxID=325217 RepID=UPI002417D9D8|nr:MULTISPECIES: SDR family NAD(P)-dependent oxidoreductase [unclassified Mesorhizobium]WFP65623.1 SDR family NAD(P)-dependent oxidoreductase [Mesorhizobium sp. WSM4904]WFP78887.1 SDR family NAD(P)-dependent oxidoreductase [Mesorhizobium sp. WSM4906]
MANNRPVILISGSDGGIGSAIVSELMERGYRLSLGAMNARALVEKFGPETPDRIYQSFDAFDRSSAKSWVDRTAKTFGQIDGVVNAIGLGLRVTIMDDNDEDLDKLWEVNVKTPLRLVRLCMPYLEACGKGRVVNLVSLGGKRIKNVTVGYGTTKFAAMGLTHAIRTYGWDKGIRATALCPGWVKTSMSVKSPTLKIQQDEMTDPSTIAHLVRTAIELPNNAAMAEMVVNCEFEDIF